MDLAQAGIALRCHCGSDMSCDMALVQFDDRGCVRVGRQPIRCPVCGAIYRFGERLKYRLVRIEPPADTGRKRGGRKYGNSNGRKKHVTFL